MKKVRKNLARKILCGLLTAGVVGVSGSALAAEITDITQFQNMTDKTTISDDVNITTTNKYLNAIRAFQKDSVVKIESNNISVNAKLDNDFTNLNTNYTITGVFAGAFNGASYGNGATLYLGKDGTKNISINASAIGTGMDSDGKKVGLDSVGVWAYNAYEKVNNKKGGKIIIDSDNLEVNAYSKDGSAWGLLAQNTTVNATTDKATIEINAKNTKITAVSGVGNSVGIVAMSQGIININSNLEVSGDNAIVARGDAIVKINEDGKHTTKLDGDMSFDYDKATSGTKVDADVLVNLTGSESYWNGNSKVTWGTGAIPEGLEKVTGIDLRIKDGATWNPAYVEEANKGASGTAVLAQNKVTLDGGNIDLTNAKNQQIQIETLSGNNGTIKIGSEDNSLAVTKDNTATNLTVTATQPYAEKIASNDMSGAVNDLAAKVKDETNADGKTAASSVYIPETTVAGAVTADIGEDGKATNVKEAVNETNAAVSDLASISLMTWRAENNDMNKRLGELRDSKGEHGAWARMARGESKYGAQNVKNQYNYYQVGYDEKLSVDPNWTVGVALTRTEGNSTFATGTGENKHTGFAFYGSYLGDNGSFIDLIAKYARMDNDFNATAGIGNGDYKTNGYSLSAEYGKRFTKDNGFWIEPQVELTYGKVGSVDYLTSKGVNVHQDGMDSLVGRLGFSLGKNIKQGNVYVRASYLYDFDGDTKVNYTNDTVARSFEQDLGGGWWEVGVGTNINLSDATHLYFDVEKTYGGNVATPWQWNAGVRWSF